MIKLQVIGNLGKDAEVRNVNGQNVINFSVAHTFKSKDGNESTTWVEVVLWRENTAIAQYLTKGTKVFVEGTPNVRTWESAGKSGANMQLTAYSVELLGGGQPAAAPQAQPAQAQPQQQQYAPQAQQPQYAPQQQPYAQPQPQYAPQQQQYPQQQQFAPPPATPGGLPF